MEAYVYPHNAVTAMIDYSAQNCLEKDNEMKRLYLLISTYEEALEKIREVEYAGDCK